MMHSLMDQGAVAVLAEVRWPGGSWAKAYGVRDLQNRQPAEPDDRVSVASITKSMTAVSVMKLVDDGLIGLDDPVNAILDSFTTVLHPPTPITVRQLLAHTSGMPSFEQASEKTPEDFPRAVTEEISTQRALELTASLPWEAKDVGSFHYSNSNYYALGQLLEKLRGKPYTQVLHDDIIAPLGLTATSIDKPAGAIPAMIHGYVTFRGERVDVTDGGGQANSSPAFGVVSTMHDVNDFFAALLRGDLVSDASLRQMMKTASDFPFYGLGIWKWPHGCSNDFRYGGMGGFWSYRTVAVSSSDGRYQATMTLIPPLMPIYLEDPDSNNKLQSWDNRILAELQDTLNRLCP